MARTFNSAFSSTGSLAFHSVLKHSCLPAAAYCVENSLSDFRTLVLNESSHMLIVPETLSNVSRECSFVRFPPTRKFDGKAIDADAAHCDAKPSNKTIKIIQTLFHHATSIPMPKSW